MSPGEGWLTDTEVFWLVRLFFFAFPDEGGPPPGPPPGNLNPPDILDSSLPADAAAALQVGIKSFEMKLHFSNNDFHGFITRTDF
jgi:hypothetical protein